MGVDQEQHRLECEARYRLRTTGTGQAEVKAMLKEVAAKRGTEAADRLKAEMVKQHRATKGEKP